MLEGVLKDWFLPLGDASISVSILGMLEGVLKATPLSMARKSRFSFNPWYVGGGVKSLRRSSERVFLSVSILGMLEGVLKVGSSIG